jgi:uncharacterized integral membrane protein (TIGR00697 family)
MLTRSQQVYVAMAGVFLTSLIVANIIGSLLFSFEAPWGGKVLLSAGIIPFPVTFILTDLLNEFYGKQGARYVTLVGFAMSILTFVFLWVGEQLPVDSHSPIQMAQYLNISQQYTTMFLASLVAYLVGQLLDIQVFHLFRSITKHRFIWLRATGSTIISQLFDSFIVTFVAFGATLSMDVMLDLALGNYVWKFLIAVGITPLLYLGHAVLNKLIRNQEAILTLTEPEYAEPAGRA